jgi:ferredoxin
MEKTLIADPEKCTRCRICELVCSSAKWGEYNPKKSFIRILSNKDMNINIPVLLSTCDFCGKCVDNCPEEALQFVELDKAALLIKRKRMGRFPVPVINGLM